MSPARHLVATLLATAFVLSIFGRIALAGAVSAPSIVERPGPATVARLGRFEVGADVSPKPANPFDPLEMTVQLVLRDARGRKTAVDAYWFQDFERSQKPNGREVLSALGEAYWKAAYVPAAAGRWTWRWEVTTATARQAGEWHTLEVTDPPAGHGYLRVSPRDARYLAYDDGTPYFAIGENLAWYDKRGTYAYDEWLDRLAAQGATWIRVWMPGWGMGIEAEGTPLGDYTARLDRAWQLDYVFEAAAQRGIAIQLVLLHHAAFSTEFNLEWDTNPYNAVNGGPLAAPEQFFTDPLARSMFLRRVRYLVARYGARTSLEAWELWNEVDLTDHYDSATVTEWHRDVAGFLRDIDVVQHPVTTSFLYFFNDPAVIEGTPLDLVQIHFYSRSDIVALFPDLARIAVDWPRERVARYQGPVLFAELGIGSGPEETIASDPEGIGVHDGLWAGAFGEAMGTSMPWWWRLVIDADPDRYYPMFGSVAAFLRDVPWDREGFVVSEPAVTTASGRAVRAHALVGDDLALLWVKDGDVRYYTPTRVTISDAEVDLDGLPGLWCAAWWDTWAGSWSQVASVEGGPGRTLAVPSFAADVAVRLARGPRCACEPDCRPVCGDGRTSGSEQCDDGNPIDGDGCDATCHLEPEDAAGDAATPPFSVTTDTEGDGATASDLIETTVTSPLPGRITIEERASTVGMPTRFGPVTGATTIHAPDASPGVPLRVEFLLDGSRTPFVGEVVWLWDERPVPRCTGPFGEASPDPCVWSMEAAGDDLHTTLFTSIGGIGQAVRPRCSGGDVLADDPKIVVSHLRSSAADDRLRVEADLVLSDPIEPALDLQKTGLRVIVAGTTGTLLDETLAGGGYANPPGAGWRTHARPGGTRWTYANRTAAPGTVRKVVLSDRSARKPGLVRIALTTAAGQLSSQPDAAPLAAAFVIDPLAGHCGALEFPGPPAPACNFNGNGTSFVCK